MSSTSIRLDATAAELPTLLNRAEWKDLILEAIREAHADDCVDIGGGVSVSEIASRIVGRERCVVSERVTWLAGEGVLERRSGVGYDSHEPRPSYCIGDEDAEVSR